MRYTTSTWNEGDPDEQVWHKLYLTRDETARVFLHSNQASECWKRSGGEWKRAYHSLRVLTAEADRWLRANFGHREGEVWECDRYYYPDEERPTLPTGQGRGAWEAQFKSYYPRQGRWMAGETIDSSLRGVRAHIAIRQDDDTAEKISNALSTFALFFL